MTFNYQDTRVISIEMPVLVRDLAEALDKQPNGAEIIQVKFADFGAHHLEIHLKLEAVQG